MSLGEFELIERVLKPLAKGYPGALGLTDDAALVDVPAGQQLVIAKDAIGRRRPLPGRRSRPSWSPASSCA